MEQEYIVALHRNVDVEQFHLEMIEETGGGVIPAREVSVANQRTNSKRQFNYMLTSEEVDWLSKDERVYGVSLKDNPNIVNSVDAIREFNYEKKVNVVNTSSNWGLVRSNKVANPFNGAGDLAENDNRYDYVLDGSGVDVVIMDTGIQVDHPEFEDKNGVSRVQQIDWPTASGLTGLVQSATFYTDTNGHGTHVAATAVGKTYGWASEAHVYSMKVNLGGDGITDGFDIPDAFDLMLGWHNAKTNGRPTVINMSWSTQSVFLPTEWKLEAFVHRNVNYYWNVNFTSRADVYENLGLLDSTVIGRPNNQIVMPSRFASYDVSLEELIDAGCLCTVSAGNMPVKHDVPTGLDYDNRVIMEYIGPTNASFTNGNNYFANYHRGGSPYVDDAMSIGNLDSILNNNSEEQIAQMSVRGPAISMLAPGTNIISAWGEGTNYEDTSPDQVVLYPFDSNFKTVMASGTSMSAPQVAGLAAVYWSLEPTINNLELKNKLELDASKDLVYNTALDNEYDNLRTLLSTPNRILYNRYSSNTPGSFNSIGNANFE